MVNHRNKQIERPHRLSVILSVAFLFGCFLGAIWAAGLDGERAGQLRSYMSEYLAMAEQTGVTASFGSILWSHFRWCLYLLLFGLSTFGILWLPVLFGLRGFLLTFAVGCFLRVYGGTGIVPGLLLLGLPSLLWIPAMWIMTTQMMECCFLRLGSKIRAGQSASGIQRNFTTVLGMSFLLMLLCVFLEYWILPGLLPVAARMIT